MSDIEPTEDHEIETGPALFQKIRDRASLGGIEHLDPPVLEL